VEIYRNGLKLDPDFLKMRYDLISSLIMLGKMEEAEQQTDFLLENKKHYITSDYYKLKGFILLWRNQPRDALTFFQKALKMDPDNRAVLLNTGVALSLIGKSDNASIFFSKLIKMTPKDIRPFFAMIEDSVRAGDMKRTHRYVEQLFARFSMHTIIDGLNSLSNNYRTAPMSPELIIPEVKQKLIELSKDPALQKNL
jgi:predicted Zn-dependent protease